MGSENGWVIWCVVADHLGRLLSVRGDIMVYIGWLLWENIGWLSGQWSFVLLCCLIRWLGDKDGAMVCGMFGSE